MCGLGSDVPVVTVLQLIARGMHGCNGMHVHGWYHGYSVGATGLPTRRA